MSATNHGARAETSNGSARTDQETGLITIESTVVSEKPTEVAVGSTEQLTDDQLLDLSEDDSDKGDVSSDCSNETIVPETLSDRDSNFNPDLPTRLDSQNQTPLEKDGVVESDKPEADEGKSEKTVPVEAMTKSSDVEMASKPLEVKDDSVFEKHEPRSSEEKFGLKDEQFVLDPNRITMLMKGDFKRCNHVKSGRYYLPETPMLSIEGRKCMLLSRLKSMANFYPCAVSYQQCFSEIQMIGLNSCNIDDFKPLKFFYWDTSFLLINEGKPVGIKAPIEISVEWLDLRIDAEKDLVDRCKCMDLEIDWGIVSIPTPTEYPNIHLYFKAHLDSDLIKDVDTPTDPTTDKFADSFMKLRSQCAIVNVSSDKEPELPMDTLKPGQSDNGGIKTTNDIHKSMTNNAIDALHLDFRGEKDRLPIEDMHKYTGAEKFNPRSSQSGSSVGFIDLNTETKEVLFAQIRMLRELMFDVIPLCRYDHLVGNRGSKVWSKWTVRTAVLWKKQMECSMSRPGFPGCYCPITNWTDRKMFIAHWQAYHIDQHTSHILCEHEKDGNLCHYMTDRESDMKSHIHNLYKDAVVKKQASNSCVSENAWLDLTSSWSIKDLERNFKTFPESRAGLHPTLIVWVIMNTKAEDLRMKNNVFRVPVYDSEELATMKSLDTNTIKEMNIALAAKAKTKAETPKSKKSRTRRSCHVKSRELVESDSDSDDKSSKTVKPTVKETKTISKDTSLLLPEIVKSGQVEFDERH